jgi:hypothetical protein
MSADWTEAPRTKPEEDGDDMLGNVFISWPKPELLCEINEETVPLENSVEFEVDVDMEARVEFEESVNIEGSVECEEPAVIEGTVACEESVAPMLA